MPTHLNLTLIGRHLGHGKRKGTRNARMPGYILYMRRARILRRLLKKYRDAKKIDKHVYHKLYLASKGNQFKNKNVLVETIHKMKADLAREAEVVAQGEARRAKNAAQKEKRVSRKNKLLGEITENIAKPEKAEQKADAKKKAAIAAKKGAKAEKKSAPAKPAATKKEK